MDAWQHLLLFIVSLISNLLSALAGGGAGLIQLPAVIFMGLPFTLALATHKVASVALGVGASIRHWQSSTLDLRFVAIMLGAGVPGVVVGASIILHIPEGMATLALGVLTISLGLYSMVQKQFGQQEVLQNEKGWGLVAGVVMVFFLGGLNGSLTSGTGLFMTLWLVRWFGFSYQKAVAHTLVLVGLFWNGSGAITLGLLHDIAWDWLPALLLGSLIGGYLGAHLSIIKGNRLIKRVFELTTIAVGARLLYLSVPMVFG